VLIAIGNAAPGEPELVGAARRRLDDTAPLVRAAAVWAFARLAAAEDFAAERSRRLAAEEAPLVREEWRREPAGRRRRSVAAGPTVSRA
jgi:epoxyqueuosine reductase